MKRNNKILSSNILIILLISFILCLGSSVQKLNHGVLKKILSEDSAQTISKAISDIIREFYVSQKIKFEFIVYGNKTNHINDVINGIEIQTSTTIRYITNSSYWDHKLNKSAIFFLKSLKEMLELHHYSIKKDYKNPQFTNQKPGKFKFLVYIEEVLTLERLERNVRFIPYLMLMYNAAFTFHEFFIFGNEQKLILAPNVYYSEKKCGEIQLKELNSFDKKLQIWKNNLKNYDHYQNFYGCLLNFQVVMQFSFYPKGFSINNVDLSDKNLKFNGIMNTLVEIMAEKHNFTLHYTILSMDENKNPVLKGTKNYNASLLYSFLLMINVHHIYYQHSHLVHISNPLFSVEYYFLISYNEFYTNYEKLTFPFDTVTWILIFIIFGLTFGIIFGFRFCPRWLRKNICGEGISSPAYNALGIFFGISQLRLPKKTLSRSIWLLFTGFCLIIRTCWQSKMFEFMTSDMRKPLPESIEDLLKMNYKVVMYDEVNIYDEILNGRERPQFEFIDVNIFFLLYKQALDGETKSKYAFLLNTLTHAFLNSSFNDTLPIMKNERITRQYVFKFPKNNIILNPLNDIIHQLIPSGVLEYEVNYDLWYLYRPFDVIIEDTKKVLSMFDLEFGFVIFLGILSLSIVVFICELMSISIKRRLRKLLGLYEFLRVVKERLRDYHDRW